MFRPQKSVAISKISTDPTSKIVILTLNSTTKWSSIVHICLVFVEKMPSRVICRGCERRCSAVIVGWHWSGAPLKTMCSIGWQSGKTTIVCNVSMDQCWWVDCFLKFCQCYFFFLKKILFRLTAHHKSPI